MISVGWLETWKGSKYVNNFSILILIEKKSEWKLSCTLVPCRYSTWQKSLLRADCLKVERRSYDNQATINSFYLLIHIRSFKVTVTASCLPIVFCSCFLTANFILNLEPQPPGDSLMQPIMLYRYVEWTRFEYLHHIQCTTSTEHIENISFPSKLLLMETITYRHFNKYVMRPYLCVRA